MKLENGVMRPDRETLLEFIVINLVSYLNGPKTKCTLATAKPESTELIGSPSSFSKPCEMVRKATSKGGQFDP